MTIVVSKLNFKSQRGYDWAGISPKRTHILQTLKAALEAFHAADTKYKEKISKHFKAYALENADFAPLILESTGAIHPRTICEIQALVTLNDQHHPIQHSFTIRGSFQYWTHSLSIAAVRATMRKQADALKYARIKVARLLNDRQLSSNHAQPIPPPLILSNHTIHNTHIL